ncbi:double-strand break repair protein MRE11 isoform X2 [Periplaneta americana]|uniref:double-strand break repair protein MRE11 isoform X2 n=1 Tax=Periplaneta americana TaxID=6978 RepID=UPI0037E8E34F
MSSDVPPPEDTLNILVASDIHLGYAEKDGIRGEDSYTTFEEILALAEEKNVDLVLLGGDLFHESKPSPKCIHRCMSLMRKYCMGDRPVAVSFLSDQTENFKHCDKPIVNYEDPNLNISIPIFSIHGNHDDPSGYGRVSSLDLLSAPGLLNYFGKWTDLTHVEISPLLMQKGETRLALYGLSYLKDERLARLFLDHHVKMFRPRECQDEWLNVFVLHQNRVDRGIKRFITEEMLPDFLDLVIWGHEHECRIKPEWNDNRRFYVCQPGSPVATSLCVGEAVPKNVAVLSIYKKNFKITPIPLKTVRPFVYDSVTLADCTIDFTGEKPSDEVQNYLRSHVETLIDRAAEQISGDLRQPDLPLIRLRVDYSEEKHMFNGVRFGLQFAEKVANPSELVLFHKQRVDRVKTEGKVDKDALEALFSNEERQGLSGNRVEKVVESYFKDVAPDKQLQVLSIKGLAEAASRFIDKEDKDALSFLVDHQMNKIINHLLAKKDLKIEDIDQQIENFRLERQVKEEEDVKDARNALENPSRQKVGKKSQNVTTIADSDSDDNTGIDLDFNAAATTSRGRGRGRGTATTSRARGGRGSRARGATTSRARGRGEQVSIRDAFSQQKERPSPRTASRKVVVFDVDSDED